MHSRHRRSWLKDSFNCTTAVRSFETHQNCGTKRRETPARGTTAEETKKVTATLASNAAVTDADLDALLPDEGYETLPPPKQNAQPEG